MSSLEKDDGGDVAQPSLAHRHCRPWWDVIECVRGGTSKIRELGESYLPKEPGEDSKAYKRRLSRVVLSPWYSRLARGMVGMVLRKPVTVETKELREADAALLDEHLEDLTLQGDNLQVFAKDLFESAVDYGYAGVLIDYPNTEGSIETRADELAAGVRPYWVLYKAPEILGLRYLQVGSQRVLTQVRLKQVVTEEIGEFGEAEIEQVLVYDLIDGVVRWRVFREVQDKGKPVWTEYSVGVLSLPEIPFVLCYCDKKGRLDQPPPMLEVAYLNVRHFQLSADLDHALHIASMPRLFIFGADPEEIGALESIDEAVCIPRAEARVEWSSAQLQAFAPLQQRISEVEGQMAALGLATLATPKNVGESAEAKRLDRAQTDSIAAVIAQSLQNALNMALYYHLQYIGIAEVATAQVQRDFDLSQLDPAMISALYQIRQGGDLSQETFLELLKKGEIGLPDDFDIEAEIERLQSTFEQQTAPVLSPEGDTEGFV